MSIGWYRTGTVSVTQNSSEIVGTGTYWLTAGLNQGDIIKINGVDYELLSVTDNTHLTIMGTYSGSTGSGKAYAIIRNFTSTTQSKLAKDLTGLMSLYEQVRDGEFLTLQGKSAYQVACEKGYVGTESEWLEWLKADNEWAVLDARTARLTWERNAGLCNNTYRGGVNLGSQITAEQLTAVKSGKYGDMALGDYWTLPSGKKAVIAGFKYCAQMGLAGGIVLFTKTTTDITDPANELVPNGAYTATKWYTDTRVNLITELEEFFGADNIPKYKIYAPVSYEGNIPSAFAEVNSKVHMPTYSMVTGFSPYHAKNPYNSWGLGNNYFYPQLPVIRSGYSSVWGNTHTADMGAGRSHQIVDTDGCGQGFDRSSWTTSTAYANYFVNGVYFLGCSVYQWPI